MPIERASALSAVFAAVLASSQAFAAGGLTLAFAGAPKQIVYNARADGCAPIDTPDIAPSAFRDDTGGIVMFGLHYVNRALRGRDFAHLKIDCHVALNSGLAADPAAWNDRRYIAGAWTNDGKRVTAIVHHEYHGDTHKTCAAGTYMACWHNAVLSFSSGDGGRNFSMDKPAVVAAPPFPQSAHQGRHRGFFNPSNIVSDGRFKYFLASTTGWDGQPYGVCLFRSPNPHDSASWRAYDGGDFTIRYTDPYAQTGAPAPKPCAIIEPFLFPVQSLTRHRPSGQWIAVWMATRNERQFPVDGFYYAVSADLKSWTLPKILRAGATLLSSPCSGELIAYPALLDETSQGRNFDNIGDSPWLFSANIETEGCNTGNRILIRERMTVSAAPKPGGEKR